MRLYNDTGKIEIVYKNVSSEVPTRTSIISCCSTFPSVVQLYARAYQGAHRLDLLLDFSSCRTALRLNLSRLSSSGPAARLFFLSYSSTPEPIKALIVWTCCLTTSSVLLPCARYLAARLLLLSYSPAPQPVHSPRSIQRRFLLQLADRGGLLQCSHCASYCR